MSEPKLTLEKFETIFHLLAAYYFFLAVSDKFNYYFDFSETIKEYSENVKIEDLRASQNALMEKREAALNRKKQITTDISNLNMSYEIWRDEIQTLSVEASKMDSQIYELEKAVTKVGRGKKIIDLHSAVPKSNQSMFFLFYKFYYTATACYCVCLLILQGYIEIWNREINLEVLNLLNAAFCAYVIAKLVTKKITKTFLFTSNVWLFLIVTGVIFLFSIALNMESLIMIELPLRPHLSIGLYEIQVLVALLLVFLPLVIHCLYLFMASRLCKNVRQIVEIINIELTKPAKSYIPKPQVIALPEKGDF